MQSEQPCMKYEISLSSTRGLQILGVSAGGQPLKRRIPHTARRAINAKRKSFDGPDVVILNNTFHSKETSSTEKHGIVTTSPLKNNSYYFW